MKKIFPFCIFLFFSIGLFAQNFTGGFNFAFPYKDSLASPFLPKFNSKALDANSKVSALGNSFLVNNLPYKFWGVNIVASGAFPDKTEASGIAAHAAKMGINLVRFHHLDNPNWSNNGSLFVGGQTTRVLNTLTLDKLDYLIYQLKQHGIYTNMNMNVSRTFNNLDGVPGADSLLEFGKGVTLFDPQLISFEKEYASQLFGHTNPYTGIKLSDDPALAMVEMVNENSLYGMWKDDNLMPQTLSSTGFLTWRHQAMLDSMWNNFLLNKYGTQTALQAAWTLNASTSTEHIIDGGFEAATLNANWQNELHNGSVATFTQDATVAHSGNKSAKINITTATGTDWHIQFKQVGFSIQKDTSYTIVFWAKANTNRQMTVALMQNSSPYNWYGGTTVNLTTNWQPFSLNVSPYDNILNDARLTFSMGQSTGTIWLDDVSLKESQRIAFNANENLANLNIQRTLYSQRNNYAKQRLNDLARFYIGIQKNFLEDMRNYLKNTLGITAPITGNNAFTGIQEGLENENLDFYDDHSYWDHPNFPGVAWDPSNWYIGNTAMSTQNGYDAIPDAFSGIPLNNKPITISEYNHASPNRFRTEMVPAIAAYGSFQGMDGLMFFDYNGDGTNWSNDVCNNFFDIHRDHSIMSLFPAASYAFRNNLIAEGNPFLINYSDNDIYNSYQKDGTGRWGKYTPYDKKIQLTQVLRAGTYHDANGYTLQTLPTPQNGNYTTTTNEINLNTNNGILTTNTSKYVSISGYLNNAANTSVGPITIINANDFGAITWVSINNKNLNVSDTSFISIASKQQNTGMVWSNNNTSVNANWGTSPTLQMPLTVTANFNIAGTCMLVHTLNTQGQRIATKFITATTPNNFIVSFNQAADQTLWYAIEVLQPNAIEWTGAVNNDWNNAANWCCGQLPGPLSNVVINNGKPNYPSVTANITIWSLKLNAGAACSVAPGIKINTQGH